MAEKLEEVQVCENCGADVRQYAAFCYNCGSQVVPDDMVDAVNSGQVSNAWFKESITEKKSEVAVKEPKIIDKSGIELTPLAVAETLTIEAATKPQIEAIQEDSKPLKTASSMRQKPKFAPKKQVEVTWEEPKSAPNIWFLIVAFILLIFAVSLVATMLYIR
ncbi:MAG: zinc ribbon domain-containing protein [Acidobacteriota bacterium]